MLQPGTVLFRGTGLFRTAATASYCDVARYGLAKHSCVIKYSTYISYTENYRDLQNSYRDVQKVTELEISSWNILCLLRSEVAHIGTGHILP